MAMASPSFRKDWRWSRGSHLRAVDTTITEAEFLMKLCQAYDESTDDFFERITIKIQSLLKLTLDSFGGDLESAHVAAAKKMADVFTMCVYINGLDKNIRDVVELSELDTIESVVDWSRTSQIGMRQSKEQVRHCRSNMSAMHSLEPDSILSLGQDMDASMMYMGDPEVLARNIHANQIGHAVQFKSPFGLKQVLYCDYIASGRSLQFIEKYIHEQVLPLYANTHTTTTITAQQTTSFRNEARSIIRGAVNASADADVVIFTGSGTTGAIHKLISSLYLNKLDERPLVFNSGQEHHSNLLPWREVGCEMVAMSETLTGEIDINDLERKLAEYRKLSKSRLIIGLFAAASNVSGILNDDLALTAMMHKYGGLAFWDYAAAAPYVNIDMNPALEQDEFNLCAKDAIYFSMHKFVGGPQTPGVLVAKKELFKNPVPHAGGGGTVVYVTDKFHQYVDKIEDREEGGTPAIVESIRAGLTMYVKENVGAEFIMKREEQVFERAKERLAHMPNLIMLGPNETPKLPILSFMIKCPTILGEGFLHHNFVCYVLNDVFGIQARGGCACAGPYVANLLGLSDEKISLFLNPLKSGTFERFKPGFARLSLPWFAPDEEIEYILDALEMVAKDGWKLLPQYEFNSETGDWQHFSKTGQQTLDKKWLNDLDLYQEVSLVDNDEEKVGNQPPAPQKTWPELITEGQKTMATARSMAKRVNVQDQRSLFTGTAGKIRWFILPFEAKQALILPNSISSSRKIHSPFWPKKYQPNKVESHDVGIYSGRIHFSPILAKLLANSSQKRATPIGRKMSNGNGNKTWFNKTFLPSLMGSKTMTTSTSSPVNLALEHEHCADDEEQHARQYWQHQTRNNLISIRG